MKIRKLDEDWIPLVKEAMQSGVSKEQFKKFIELKRIEKGK